MKTKRLIKSLLGRILAPSYVGTAFWLLTDDIVLAIGGAAVSVALTMVMPFLETGIDAAKELRETFNAKRRTQLLDTFIQFINAYKNVVAKYPLDVLPDALTHNVAEQLGTFDRYLRRLKGLRIKQYATAYDAVRAMAITPNDFTGWDVDACATFVDEMIQDLSHASLASLRQALKRFDPRDAESTWQPYVCEAEQVLDDAVDRHLASWPMVQEIGANPDIRSRVETLLQTEAVSRQASLQVFLAKALPHYRPAELHTMVRSLQYDAVVEVLSALITPEEQKDAHSGRKLPPSTPK